MSLQNLNFAYAASGSVTGLILRLFNGGVLLPNGSTYSGQHFVSDWSRGGKQYIEGKWRDAANTPTGHLFPSDDGEGNISYDEENIEEYRGKHEWVPTNMLAYVLENAITHGHPEWLLLAEALRSATRNVIFKPSLVSYTRNSNNPYGLSGHVGAIYVEYGGRPHRKFKGQGGFHDGLRNILRTHLNPSTSDISAYCTDLENFIGTHCWLGDMGELANFLNTTVDGLQQLPCPYGYLSGVNQCSSWGSSMFDMANNVKAAWDSLESPLLTNNFRAAIAAANHRANRSPTAPFQAVTGEEFHPSAHFAGQ